MNRILFHKTIPVKPTAHSGHPQNNYGYRALLRSYFPSPIVLDLDYQTSFKVSLYFKIKYNKHHFRRDLDNLAKSFLDAGTGIFWKDDSQINELNLKINKYAKKESITISISILSVSSCDNCFHHSNGFCLCREVSDIVRTPNKCPDWSPKYESTRLPQ